MTDRDELLLRRSAAAMRAEGDEDSADKLDHAADRSGRERRADEAGDDGGGPAGQSAGRGGGSRPTPGPPLRREKLTARPPRDGVA